MEHIVEKGINRIKCVTTLVKREIEEAHRFPNSWCFIGTWQKIEKVREMKYERLI